MGNDLLPIDIKIKGLTEVAPEKRRSYSKEELRLLKRRCFENYKLGPFDRSFILDASNLKA